MKKFVELFKEALEIENRELNMADEFRTYPEWSSLAFLSLISMLDDEYGVVIETVEFRQLKTLQQLFEIQKRIG